MSTLWRHTHKLCPQCQPYPVLSKVNIITKQVKDSKVSDISPHGELGFSPFTQSRTEDEPHNKEDNPGGQEVREPKVRLWARRWEKAAVGCPAQVSARRSPLLFKPPEDLCSVRRAIGHRVWQQGPFVSGQTSTGLIWGIWLLAASLFFLKGSNQSWASADFCTSAR